MADLKLYTVGVRGHTTTMQLSDEDAQAYKDQGVSVEKASGKNTVAPAERQPVTAPPYAVDEHGEALPLTDDGVRQRSRTPRNKSRK